MSANDNAITATGQSAEQAQYSGELATTATAAQSKAMVEARFLMALRCPRDWGAVRQCILDECKRPSFANNKSAFYIKPIGKGVEGLGIRFAEMALRHMKNVLIEASMIFEDVSKEIQRVTVTDLEANITYPMDICVSKTVERSKPMDDGTYISMRINSSKKPVYTIPAADEELLNKRGALLSKAIRTLGLRIIPGDICDEAEAIIKAVRRDSASKDPAGERKRVINAFEGIWVTENDLIAYLKHPLDACTTSELVNLRGIYGAIRDGESTWQSVIDNEADHKKDAPDNAASTPVEAAATTPVELSNESFDKKKVSWRNLIESGKKSAKDLLAFIETKEKLNEDQRIEITSWMPK